MQAGAEYGNTPPLVYGDGTSIHNGLRRALQPLLYSFATVNTRQGGLIICVALVCGAVYGFIPVCGAFLLPCGKEAAGPRPIFPWGPPDPRRRKTITNKEEDSMKKVLSLVMAIAMISAMTATGFAAVTVSEWTVDQGISIT